MGNVTNLSDFRRGTSQKAATPPTKANAPTITRTPALALVMALYEQLPREYTGPALVQVMAIAGRNPDCEASQEAGRIAALLAFAKEGR